MMMNKMPAAKDGEYMMMLNTMPAATTLGGTARFISRALIDQQNLKYLNTRSDILTNRI